MNLLNLRNGLIASLFAVIIIITFNQNINAFIQAFLGDEFQLLANITIVLFFLIMGILVPVSTTAPDSE